jgi:CubicO group peptidase (beta-lactamase class C family)
MHGIDRNTVPTFVDHRIGGNEATIIHTSTDAEVTHSLHLLNDKYSQDVAPIQTMHQKLALFVVLLLQPIVFLLNLFKSAQPTVAENSQQDTPKVRDALIQQPTVVAPIVETPSTRESIQAISTITDALIDDAMQARHIPSVVVSVIHQGQIVKTAAYGVAQDNRALAEVIPDFKRVELLPANTETVYRVDSLSKQFTAAAILKLVEQGYVNLDATIDTYIIDAPWKDITVRQLITHEAGFAYQLSGEKYPSIATQDQFPIPQDYSTRLFDQERDPGKHIYSNIGYDILGVIIKNITKKSYSAFMQETFFTPLKMANTGVSNTVSDTDNFAIGYALQGTEKTLAALNFNPFIDEEINEDIPLAGAGIFSTIEDMTRWEFALQGSSILSRASKQLLSDLVWSAGETDEGTTFLATSGVGWGYNASFIRYPASQSAVIVMANLNGTGPDNANIAELAFEIAQLYPLG